MHITSLLNERNVAINFEASTKEEALEKLIAVLGTLPKVLDIDTLRHDVLRREEMATTGIGDGIAIPHTKTEVVSDILAAFAILKEPIDFHALDDQPVRIIFLLVGMESRVGPYLKILSRARRLMSSASFRKRLLQAKSSKDIIEAFREEEERYFEMV